MTTIEGVADFIKEILKTLEIDNVDLRNEIITNSYEYLCRLLCKFRPYLHLHYKVSETSQYNYE